MPINLQELVQNKRNLGIIAALLVVVLAGVLVFMFRGGSQQQTALGPAGMPGMPGGPMPMGMGLPPPDPGTADSPDAAIEQQMMFDEMIRMQTMGAGPGGAPGAGAPPAQPLGEDFPKGPPVEPFRRDPFEAPIPKRPAPPQPVIPPVVVAIQTPLPMPVPATVNVIPTAVWPTLVAQLQRRVSGVLWNGKVVAILESPTDPNGRVDIVRPGDYIPGKELFVKSISRDKMVIIDESTPERRELTIDLKGVPGGDMATGLGGMPGGMDFGGAAMPMPGMMGGMMDPGGAAMPMPGMMGGGMMIDPGGAAMPMR